MTCPNPSIVTLAWILLCVSLYALVAHLILCLHILSFLLFLFLSGSSHVFSRFPFIFSRTSDSRLHYHMTHVTYARATGYTSIFCRRTIDKTFHMFRRWPMTRARASDQRFFFVCTRSKIDNKFYSSFHTFKIIVQFQKLFFVIDRDEIIFSDILRAFLLANCQNWNFWDNILEKRFNITRWDRNNEKNGIFKKK